MAKEPFIINRLKSIGFAFRGLVLLLKTEASIQLQFIIAIVVTAGGFYFNISRTEWLIQIAMIGLVISIEGLNTAIESMADFIHPEQHQQIGKIKDMAAGAVLIAAILAVITGVLIYIPKMV